MFIINNKIPICVDSLCMVVLAHFSQIAIGCPLLHCIASWGPRHEIWWWWMRELMGIWNWNSSIWRGNSVTAGLQEDIEMQWCEIKYCLRPYGWPRCTHNVGGCTDAHTDMARFILFLLSFLPLFFISSFISNHSKRLILSSWGSSFVQTVFIK